MEICCIISFIRMPNNIVKSPQCLQSEVPPSLLSQSCNKEFAALQHTQVYKCYAQLGGFDWSISVGQGGTRKNSHVLLAAFDLIRNSKPFPVGRFWPLQ